MIADADLSLLPAGREAVFRESGGFTTHGEPSPAATFRFAEPVFIDKQQNFRVEIPASDTPTSSIVSSGFNGPFQHLGDSLCDMTRDVQ